MKHDDPRIERYKHICYQQYIEWDKFSDGDNFFFVSMKSSEKWGVTYNGKAPPMVELLGLVDDSGTFHLLESKVYFAKPWDEIKHLIESDEQ